MKTWTHCTKVNDCFSNRPIIEYKVVQISNSGPLLFSINMVDLYIKCDDSEIANSTEDRGPYFCVTDNCLVISELEVTSTKLLNWFDNKWKTTPRKCYLLLSFKTPQLVFIGGSTMISSPV